MTAAGFGTEVLGPVQVLVIGVEEEGARGRIAAELGRLAASDGVRILDLLSARRLADGEFALTRPSGPFPAEGRLVEALLGADRAGSGDAGDRATARPAREEVWYLADRVPPGRSAEIVLVEHRWAIPLREAASEFESEIFGDAWLHPQDLANARSAVGGSGPEPS
ncbi:MAG: hypothetical protein JST31_01265 [Actinobacteria bacterium]|nr:hypothetical protein [Actinomycetota bacterium]